ncbi:hypothetical protein Tco_0005415 [Tanacetum coccineum]
MTSKAQQIELDNALVAPENRRVIGKCNMRINPGMKPKEPTYQATFTKHKASYRFKIDNKKFFVNGEVFRDILNICPRIPGQEFEEPLTKEEALSFIRELGHYGEIKYITDVIIDNLHQPWRTFASIINKCLYGKVSGLNKIRLSRVQILWGMYYKKNLDFVALIWEDLAYQIDNIDSKKQDKMFYPRFMKIIIHHFLEKDKSISMRNRTFMHTARDDSLLGTMRFVSRHADTQVYGAILPEAMINQALLDYVAYKTYYAITSGVEPPKLRKSQKKSDSAISSKESPSKKKSAKAKEVAATKPKLTKKKEPIKANRGKILNVLSEVALSEVAQLKEGFLMSNIARLIGTDEGTGTKPWVSDVPKYDFKSEKESWGDSGEEDDDDEDATEDDKGNDATDGNDNNNDDDANDDDNQEDDDTNDDDKETDNDMTESDRIKILVLNQSSTEYYEEEEEKIDDEEKMDEEEDDEVTKELYNDVNVNLGNRDDDMTDADQGGADQQNISQESGFEQVEEDAHNPSLADNEIASLMDTTVRHEEPRSQTSSLYTIPKIPVLKITSISATTIPPPPPFFNPLPQQATQTPTPTTSEATTLFPSHRDFSYVFKFNDKVTNLEKDMSEIKQFDKYAQALSFILAIVDRYIDNKLGKAIQKAILAHNLDSREEAQAEKRDYIELVDISMRAILNEEVNTQLPQILPQAV